MAATIPNKIEKFSVTEKDEFTSIAQANWRKMSGLLEYLNRSFPIGMLLFFHETQDALPETPDPKYWQFADGSMVSNANSPLNGQTLPDLRNRFIRHPNTGQPALVNSGQDTVNLQHNHGGITGAANDALVIDGDNGGDGRFGAFGWHTHGIANALSTTVSTIPQYRYLQIYVRIA